MKKFVNGKIVDMTEEEVAMWEKSNAKPVPVLHLSLEDRIEALEAALLELAEVMCNG